MNTNTKLDLSDSMSDVLFKMSEGNPGAIGVCLGLMNHGDKIDPDSFAGGMGAILMLDSLGIYGPRIWMLFKDVCGQDYVLMVAMIRAWQLGILNEERLNYEIDGGCREETAIDVQDVLRQVQEQLPQFGKVTYKCA